MMQCLVVSCPGRETVTKLGDETGCLRMANSEQRDGHKLPGLHFRGVVAV